MVSTSTHLLDLDCRGVARLAAQRGPNLHVYKPRGRVPQGYLESCIRRPRNCAIDLYSARQTLEVESGWPISMGQMIDNGKRAVVLVDSDTNDGGWIASDFHNSCRLGRRYSVLWMCPSRVGLTERKDRFPMRIHAYNQLSVKHQVVDRKSVV